MANFNFPSHPQQPYAPYQQQPLFDLNSLEDNTEIHMKYDQNGNLVSIRKRHRPNGCGGIFLLLLTALLCWGACTIL